MDRLGLGLDEGVEQPADHKTNPQVNFTVHLAISTGIRRADLIIDAFLACRKPENYQFNDVSNLWCTLASVVMPIVDYLVVSV